MIIKFREWWSSLRPTERKRLLLVLSMPLLGLIVTGYQLTTTILGTPEVRPYDIAPPAAISPTVEPALFDPSEASKPLMNDDVFIGIHRQVNKDIVWLGELDLEYSKTLGSNVWPKIKTAQEILPPDQIKSYALEVAHVSQSGVESAEAFVSLTYTMKDDSKVKLDWRVLYQIIAPAGKQTAYTFKPVGLDNDNLGSSSSQADE